MRSPALPASLAGVSLKSFFAVETHDAVVSAVQDVETQTSAELVVVVRVRSGRYPEAHARAGAILALAALLLLLFLPQEFPLLSIPINVLFGYAVGWALGRFIPPIERALSSPSSRADRTLLAARAEMIVDRITATTGRTGMLVYVSVLERQVHLVCDLAVEAVRGEAGFQATERKIIEAGRRLEPQAFIAALRELGPTLAGPLPCSSSDVNELADGVRS